MSASAATTARFRVAPSRCSTAYAAASTRRTRSITSTTVSTRSARTLSRSAAKPSASQAGPPRVADQLVDRRAGRSRRSAPARCRAGCGTAPASPRWSAGPGANFAGDGSVSRSSRRVPAQSRGLLLGGGVEHPHPDASRPRRPAPGTRSPRGRRGPARCCAAARRSSTRSARYGATSGAAAWPRPGVPPGAAARCSAGRSLPSATGLPSLVEHPEGDPQVRRAAGPGPRRPRGTGHAGHPAQLAGQRGEQRLLARRDRGQRRRARSRAPARSCAGPAWAATGSAR